MGRDRDPLDYATPRRAPSARAGPAVRGVGVLLLVGGILWAFMGTAGVDDRVQILTGWVIAGKGLLVAVLGQILHVAERRR